MPKTITQLIGRSPAFQKALDEASLSAGQESPVLIYGETGSGKGMIASFIHRKSRRSGRLVSLNCATFQASLFESELFGHMKGSFTGAVKDTAGLFEAAEGGTLFLDEIGDTPLELQPKLLRAIEEGRVRRVGGTKEIPVDTRLVCATNHDLKQLIADGKFREDLYYRINSFVVNLPALRDRQADLEELAAYFLADLTGSDVSPPALSVEVVDALHAYTWPGNVRELRSAMAYALAQSAGRATILRKDLPDAVQADPAPAPLPENQPGHIEDFRDLYRYGAEDQQRWARFLLALNEHLGSNRFSRGDMLECLRAVRGDEPTNNSLVNEWQRHIKPVPLRLGLIHEDGKKLRIDLDACNRALNDAELPDENEPITETAVERPRNLSERYSRTNLDASRTTFIGRSQQLQQLVEMLLGGTPSLITITGPGGTGKTRLSREVGRALLGQFPGGIWFADLTESLNIEGVAYAVAQALGVPLTGNQTPELAVGSILKSRAPCLLILDNFEQVAEVASATVGDWVRHAPQVQVLVTSRALLGIEGEQEFELQPLNLPNEDASPEQVARSEAVRLFIERARVHHVGFTLNDKNSAAVARICAKMEGMPLAIELAAARTVIMQPEQIADRLDHMFEMLKSSRRDLPPRQRSLHATIDWSYNLLNEVERWAFAQLSVFRGGFFLDAVESILDLSRFPEAPSAMDVIQSLREKSLLRAIETPYETRFAMYLVIREYAAERWQELASDTEREAVTTRFSDYFRQYLDHWDKRIHTAEAMEALDRLDYARSNLKALLDWASQEPISEARRQLFVEVSLRMHNLFRIRGPARQRVPSLRAALDMLGDRDPIMRARLLFLIGLSEREAGDPAVGDTYAREAVELSETTGDEELIATAKFNLAGVEYAQGNTARAQEMHREVLPVFERTGNLANQARVLTRMALLDTESENFDTALEYSRRSEAIMRDLGDPSGLAFVLSTRGNIYHRRGEIRQALAFLAEAETMYRKLDNKRMIALCLGNRALMLRQLRQFDKAEPLVRECSDLARETGDRPTLSKNLMNTGIMYVELARYEEAETALREAAVMFTEQNQPRLHAVCIENLALIAARNGDLEGALGGFSQAEALCNGVEDTTLTGIRIAHAETLIAAGRTQEAAPIATEAVTSWRAHTNQASRDFFRALTAKAQATGDQATAREALEVAQKVHLKPDDPSPFIRDALQILKNLSAG